MRISVGSARSIISIAGLIVVLTVARSSLAGDQVPFVRLREEAGHLRFDTCLPAGRGTFEAIDPAGLKLAGFVFVTGEADAKRPRIFRLRGTILEDAAGEVRGDDSPAQFLIKLQTTPNPDHYELHIEVEHFAGGQPVKSHATLGRNCCGYHVSAASPDRKLPIGRGALLTDVMVAAPETYREFERLAQICCRPGFEFVPGSLLSPSIVEEVIATDEAEPSTEAAAEFEYLLADLDSDEFPEREAATAQLIRRGRTTLWSLDHLNGDVLSAEQRHRVGQVRQALSHYSEPALPFQFSSLALRELSEAPPQAWLATLCQSTDPRVSGWAREKSTHAAASSSTIACPAEGCQPQQQH